MTDDDLVVLAKGMAPVITEIIEKSLGGITSRLAALEQRAMVPGRDGRDGMIGPPGPMGEKGLDGKDGLAGRDGSDGQPGEPGPMGPAGADGRDGLDGKDGTPGRDGEIGPMGLPGEKGEPGPAGRDGIDGAVGPMGPQGDKGLDGLHGKDGRDGIDGKDGLMLTAENFQSVEFDGEKTITLVFGRDEHVKTWPIVLPIPIYRDVWSDAKAYEPGDIVTWGGNMYIAKAASTGAKPGLPTDASRAWRMCVKAGRDGKAGPMGQKGADGRDGRPGKDLTAMDAEGRKW